MADVAQCVRCGAQVSTDLSADGICPTCLLKLGLALPDHATGEDTTVSASPTAAVRTAGGQLLSSGQTFGTYRIERLLGKGGMGEVYEAEELDSGRRVAIKVLHQALADAKDRTRFLREGQLAASVNHPNAVYIFGSDDIGGTPIIVMEFLAAGTLKDRVRDSGPLPPTEAVDAILQVIAGLDAAQAGDILHRDIKPSNCFVDRDGTVKIGDFGLSISTMARDGTQLSRTGTFQGMPQFAAPEQLKGDPLDVRADIYAVGATLYYLLTGTPPFDADDLMALVARIATEAPPSPRDRQPGVPKALASVVLKCLAKDRAARPATYAALTDVLRPLSSYSQGGAPAPIGARFVGGLIDIVVCYSIGAGLALGLFSVLGVSEPPVFFILTVVVAVFCLYFALTERNGGASLGKRLLGFRVVSLDHQGRTSFARTLLRSVTYVAFHALALGVGGALGRVAAAGEERDFVADSLVGLAQQFSTVAAICALFALARRRNGFAALHDLVSRTRVVQHSPQRVARPRVAALDPAPPLSGARIGPYRVVAEPPPALPTGFVAAYDEALRRPVWIRRHPPSTPPVSPARRDLSRPARLRWLGGTRDGDAWDAYEAIDGGPLVDMLDSPRTWGEVRHWLHGLAEEVRAGLADRSLPDLGLDRVWITSSGSVRLCEAPAGGTNRKAGLSVVPGETASLSDATRFLHAVAMAALEGSPGSRSGMPRTRPATPLPLAARRFMEVLGSGRATSLDQIVKSLATLLDQSPSISVRRRAVHLGVCAIWPAFGLVLSLLARGSIPFAWMWVPQLIVTMLAGLLSAALIRGGLLLRLLGIAIVTEEGVDAAGWRVFVRALIAWSPVVAVVPVLPFAVPVFPFLDTGPSATSATVTASAPAGTAVDPVLVNPALLVLVVLIGLWVVGAIWAALHPDRGIQDRIAGTWLVPR